MRNVLFWDELTVSCITEKCENFFFSFFLSFQSLQIKTVGLSVAKVNRCLLQESVCHVSLIYYFSIHIQFGQDVEVIDQQILES